MLDAPTHRRPSRDADLRRLVHRRLLSEHGGDLNAVIVDELSICGARARMDIALVNGELSGFEIKSDVDGLGRLASQTAQYARVFNQLTLVCAPRHARTALARLPKWWGLWVAEPQGARPLDELRTGAPNPGVCMRATAGLLWRDEMLELLVDGGASGMGGRPRRDLVAAIVDVFDEVTLCAEVRQRLRERLRRADLGLSAD